MHNARPKDHHA